jgi:hypothetical protein
MMVNKQFIGILIISVLLFEAVKGSMFDHDTVRKWACVAYYMSRNPDILQSIALPTEDGNKLHWTVFRDKNLLPNTPVVINNVGQDWPIRSWAHIHENVCARVTGTGPCHCSNAQSLMSNVHQNDGIVRRFSEGCDTVSSFYDAMCPEVHHAVTASSPDLDTIRRVYGESEVSIVDCALPEFNSQW